MIGNPVAVSVTASAKSKDRFLAELISEQGPGLQRYLARKLDSPEDAAEIAQETFLRLHRMQSLETLDNARAYLFQTASNLATDQLRRRGLYHRYLNRERDSLLHDEHAGGARNETLSPEHVLAARQKLQAIMRAIEELPLPVRQAFLLHRRSGLSYDAIASEMGVSVSSVEKYILQALRHCRRCLAHLYPDD